MSRVIEPLIDPVPGGPQLKMGTRAVARYVRGILSRVKIAGQGCQVRGTASGQVIVEPEPWQPSYINYIGSDTSQLVRVAMPPGINSGPVQPWSAVPFPTPPGLATCRWAAREIQHLARSFGLDVFGNVLRAAASDSGTVIVRRDQSHTLHPWRVSINDGTCRVQPGGLGAYGYEGDIIPTMAGLPLDGSTNPSIFVGVNFTGWIALTTYWSGTDPVSVEAWEVVATSILQPKGSGSFAHVPIAYIVGGQVAVQLTRNRIGVGSSGERAEISWGWA